MSDAILRLDTVTKLFDSKAPQITALDQVSFEIKPGEVTGLIGPDGAGKTTLMRLIAGLLIPDSGHIEAIGIDVNNAPPRRAISAGLYAAALWFI